MIIRLLQPNPADRLHKIDEILQHPWFSEKEELLNSAKFSEDDQLGKCIGELLEAGDFLMVDDEDLYKCDGLGYNELNKA